MKAADVGPPETSAISVDTVEKKGLQRMDSLPRFRSDASKITLKGNGFKRAVCKTPNTFQVNASTAGPNVLFVAMYGPKGPCDEVHVKHVGQNLYNVNYNVRDKGDYMLVVKWGDDHVPGSPFKVEAS